MEWGDIQRAGHIVIEGVRYDLAHLSDHEQEHVIEAADGKPELRFKMLVQYSSHCVSFGQERGTPTRQPGDAWWFRDEKGNDRWFCTDRFALSQQHLPQMFAGLERKAFFTNHHNWLTLEVMNAGGQRREYEVFFRVRAPSAHFVRLYVESAYVRDNRGSRPHPEMRRPMRLKTIVAKAIRREPVKAPPVG